MSALENTEAKDLLSGDITFMSPVAHSSAKKKTTKIRGGNFKGENKFPLVLIKKLPEIILKESPKLDCKKDLNKSIDSSVKNVLLGEMFPADISLLKVNISSDENSNEQTLVGENEGSHSKKPNGQTISNGNTLTTAYPTSRKINQKHSLRSLEKNKENEPALHETLNVNHNKSPQHKYQLRIRPKQKESSVNEHSPIYNTKNALKKRKRNVTVNNITANNKKLKKEEKTHLVCKVCGKSFLYLSGYKAHKIVHSGLKPYQCNKCDKCFTQKSHMVRHLVSHSASGTMKRYKCSNCEKSFLQKYSLEVHSKIHLGEKSYKCEECGKSFTQKSHLNTHTKKHQLVKDFTCEMCDKDFTLFHHLTSHLTRVHNKVFSV